MAFTLPDNLNRLTPPMTHSNKSIGIPGRGAGENLFFLFGASGSGRVLVIGRLLDRWRHYFPDGQFEEDFSSIHKDNLPYDLILYHSGSANSRSTLVSHLEFLSNLIDRRGHILFFGENFYSFQNLKKYGHNSVLSNTKRPRFRPGWFRNTINAAGLNIAKEFIGIPAIVSAEELVVPRSRFLEVPLHWHPLWHLAKRWGIFREVADGSIFFIARNNFEDGTPINSVVSQIQEYLGSNVCSCDVERIDIRLRGSLVVFLTEKCSRKSFITRIVSAPDAQKVVRRNQVFLTSLRNSLGFTDMIRGKLPEPIGEINFAACSLFTETLINGVLAWKVNCGSKRNTIFQSASEFIYNLQLAFRRMVVLGRGQAQQLFQEDLDKIGACPDVAPTLFAMVASEIQEIRRIMSGRECFLTVSHGDYGYGNILVNPRSGKLTGVIDWDTGKQDDFPGIDYLNLAVQRIRTERNCGVSIAFDDVCTAVIRRGSLDEGNFYTTEFNLTGDSLKIVLYAALFRYMSRAAQYPEVFVSEQAEYQKSLQSLEELAPI